MKKNWNQIQNHENNIFTTLKKNYIKQDLNKIKAEL